jgi:hypothetical protein
VGLLRYVEREAGPAKADWLTYHFDVGQLECLGGTRPTEDASSPRLGVRNDISSYVSCTGGWVGGGGGSARAGLVVRKKKV